MTTDGEAADAEPAYRLRLFVAGNTALSRRAIGNLRRICAEHVPTPYDLEVVDINQQPELAERNQVVAVPTLVKLLPLPVRRIIGDLSETGRVLHGLGLPAGPAGGPATGGHGA